MALLRHALHNTVPNIMKCVGTDENGRSAQRDACLSKNDIKVRDAEAIQLANSKIDEIRNGFTEWLDGQSQEFKDKLTEMYNEKFNCFVRPKYDGSQRALNLLFAIRTIQDRPGRDLGATFLSGTTISNSLTELYLLFKYLRPKELERQNIRCFDAWAAI